jgi:hypothetical protein
MNKLCSKYYQLVYYKTEKFHRARHVIACILVCLKSVPIAFYGILSRNLDDRVRGIKNVDDTVRRIESGISRRRTSTTHKSRYKIMLLEVENQSEKF